MAQSRQTATTADPAATLSAEEQQQLDQMQADDAAAIVQPELEAPAEPNTATEGDGQPAATQQRQQTVPHAAFHEERERRKAAEAQIADLRKQQQTLEERTNLLLQRIQPAPSALPAQPPAIPSIEENPAAHIAGLLQQHGARLDEVTRWALQQEQARQTQANIGSIQERALAMEREFLRETPDYAQAVDHLANQRRLELAAAGYTDAAEREVILRNEALQVAQRALQGNKNPAEIIYELAKVRGWKAPAAEPTEPQTNANGATTPQQRIDQVRAGQQQARSLGAARGAGPAPLNAQTLLAMSDADFSKMLETSQEARDLMGV